MENPKIEPLTPEAIQAEKEQLKEIPESEVRESLIEKYGLDESEQFDLINSLVKDKLEENKVKSVAIGQKIKQRERGDDLQTKLEEISEKNSHPKEIKHDSTDDSWKEKIEFIVKHKDFDEEQVETLSSFAKGKGISLEEAFGDKLVKRIIEEDQKEKRIANATPEGKSKSSPFKNIQRQIEEATDRNDHKKLWEELSQGKSRGVESE